MLAVSVAHCMQVNDFEQLNQEQSHYSSLKYPYEHKSYVYLEDGVEFVDASERNATLRVVVEEELFTNIQNNFIN